MKSVCNVCVIENTKRNRFEKTSFKAVFQVEITGIEPVTS